MIKNKSISRCLKSDFKAIEELRENVYMLSWGKQDVVERVSVYDEETKEHTLTGETVETDWCSYESGVYRGVLSKDVLDKCFANAQRIPKMRELKAIGEEMGMTEDEMLPWMKDWLVRAIDKHDKSKEVEDFTINGIHLWLNSDLRTKVWENLMTAQQKGENMVTLRYEGMAFPMTLEMGWQLYYAVLDYARATWDVTEINRATTMNALSVDALIIHEDTYKDAYPAKLVF